MTKELLKRILVVLIEYLVIVTPVTVLKVLGLLFGRYRYSVSHDSLFLFCHRGPFAMFLLDPGDLGWGNWPWFWWSTNTVTNIICILAYVIYPSKLTGAVSFFGIVAWFISAMTFVNWAAV